jgi:3-mercaptopyruvate sulfurtransferase SseA
MLEDSFGFKHDLLRVLQGGFQGWELAGYPIETVTAVKPMGKILTLWSKIRMK